MTKSTLTIVMPVLNEEAGLAAALQALEPLRARGAQIIVVDGDSADDSAARAQARGVQVINATRGRALQMNAGAQQASGECCCFCMPTRGFHQRRCLD